MPQRSPRMICRCDDVVPVSCRRAQLTGRRRNMFHGPIVVRPREWVVVSHRARQGATIEYVTVIFVIYNNAKSTRELQLAIVVLVTNVRICSNWPTVAQPSASCRSRAAKLGMTLRDVGLSASLIDAAINQAGAHESISPTYPPFLKREITIQHREAQMGGKSGILFASF